PQSKGHLLQVISERAGTINREDRVTGNALIGVVEELMSFNKKNGEPMRVQAVIDEFIDHQTMNPDFEVESLGSSKAPPKKLMDTLILLLQEHNEDI
ncbi:MAG: hypothetical protein GW917_03920, partial [Bdellovibrionales bacterium]|nr:hypothetical protein [Bdellovibrionales bacterium]